MTVLFSSPQIGFFTRSRNFKKMEEEKEEVTPVDL